MVHKYVFTGFSGSMGMQRGRTYRLRVRGGIDGSVIAERTFLGIVTWRCPYSSIATFTANWDRVE